MSKDRNRGPSWLLPPANNPEPKREIAINDNDPLQMILRDLAQGLLSGASINDEQLDILRQGVKNSGINPEIVDNPTFYASQLHTMIDSLDAELKNIYEDMAAQGNLYGTTASQGSVDSAAGEWNKNGGQSKKWWE